MKVDFQCDPLVINRLMRHALELREPQTDDRLRHIAEHFASVSKDIVEQVDDATTGDCERCLKTGPVDDAPMHGTSMRLCHACHAAAVHCGEVVT